MSKTSSHEILPDVSLFGKLGSRSRAFPMVTTELVDNSLDAWLLMPSSKRNGKRLKIDITAKSTKGSWFIIRDNSGGMTDGELASAMKVAHSIKDGTKVLGNFGFGLKSAAMYIGPKFRIFTRSHTDSSKVHFVEFDKNKFQDKGIWKIDIQTMSLNEASKLDVHFGDGHGTEIWIVNERFKPALEKGIINRLRKTFAPRLSAEVKAKGKFHSDDTMELTFNGKRLTALGPFYEKWNNKALSGGDEDTVRGNPVVRTDIPQIEIKELNINGKKVWGRAAILDRGMAHNNQYGFDLIKHYRVIELHALDRNSEDKRIGLTASNHNARIVGQLYLDGFDTDHQKTEFLKDSDDWIKIAEHVDKSIQSLYKISSRLQNPNQARGASASAPDSLAGKKAQESVTQINKGVQRAVRSGSVKKTLAAIEARNKPKPASGANIAPAAPVKPSMSNTRLLVTKPLTVYESIGQKEALFRSKLISDSSGDRLKVLINLDHPFLHRRESGELKAIGEFIAVDAFSEYILKSKNLLKHDDFLELRDRFLKELRTN